MSENSWKTKLAWDELIDEYLSGKPAKSAPLESASTVLYPTKAGKYDIEANTSEGLKVFKNATPTDYDAQSELDDPLSDWIDAPLDEEDDTCFVPTEPQSSDELFRSLENASGSTRRQAIFEIEAMPFHDSERIRLIELLRNYIKQYRDSTEREELIAVSAAIRKFVALINEPDMGYLANLLETGHRVQPSMDAQLEIAKMVVRRYSQSLPVNTEPHPELSACLAQIAHDYLQPYVFGQQRFSTVAMLAIQALIVMRSEHAETAIDGVNKLPHTWFRQQLARRMEKIFHQMPDDTPGIEDSRELIGKINVH